MNNTTDLTERYLEDIKQAVTRGYNETAAAGYTIASVTIPTIVSKVYEVIGKYSAVPNEPKEVTNE